MRQPIRWIVYGTYPDYREWHDNPLRHYSRDESREQAEYDALEVWSGVVHGARVTEIVRYGEAV